MSICIVFKEEEARVVKEAIKEAIIRSLGNSEDFDTLAEAYVTINKELALKEKLEEDENF